MPFRRDVAFVPSLRDTPIAELLAELHFVERNRNWGMLARRGVFEIDAHDMGVIANAMGLWQRLNSSRGVKPRERQAASLFAWTTSPTR